MARIFWQFIGILLLVGFVGAYFWWIVVAVTVVAASWALWWLWPRFIDWIEAAEAEHIAAIDRIEAEHRAVARRADQQHAWVLSGDDRGVYGVYPPASYSVSSSNALAA
jgi:hypothetical protein